MQVLEVEVHIQDDAVLVAVVRPHCSVVRQLDLVRALQRIGRIGLGQVIVGYGNGLGLGLGYLRG